VSKGFFAALLGAGALAVTTVTVGISGRTQPHHG
jgi:hypothetical protein